MVALPGLRRLLVVLLILGLSTPGNVGAADLARSPADGFTVQLSAWAEEEINNDLLTATLVVERSGADSARLAATVAGIMQRALGEAERYPAVKVRTASYATQPAYERREGVSQRTGWLVRQQLSLESTDIEAAAALIGRLQTMDLQLTGMSFTVSELRREASRAQLTAAAIDAWRTKAEAAVKRLGGRSWLPHELQIQDDYYHPVRPMLARGEAALSAEVVAPAIEAGSSKIRVTVSGTAWGR